MGQLHQSLYDLFWLTQFLKFFTVGLTLLHSERPKLHTILAFLSAIELRVISAVNVEFA